MLSTALQAATTAPVPLAEVFGSEVVGTALLTLLGCGVVANVVLTKTLGNAGGWLLVNVGWGFAVLAGVYAAFRSGAHINPAVTVGILTSGADEYAPGVAVTAGSTFTYLTAQMLGAFLGAVAAWLAYKKHFDEHTGADEVSDGTDGTTIDLRDGSSPRGRGAGSESGGGRTSSDWPLRAGASGGSGGSGGSGSGRRAAGLDERETLTTTSRVETVTAERDRSQGEPTGAPRSTPAGAADKLGVFCTGPAIPAPAWNVLTEVIGTFALVLVVLLFGRTPSGLGPAAVAFLVVGIGASLGGPTGYAINPARDLGPRIAHALLPIAGKGGSNWGYAWVPIVGPVLGAVLAGLLFRVLT
nr:MIP/aquaporin family protein [Kineosporia sp. A_224]